MNGRASLRVVKIRRPGVVVLTVSRNDSTSDEG